MDIKKLRVFLPNGEEQCYEINILGVSKITINTLKCINHESPYNFSDREHPVFQIHTEIADNKMKVIKLITGFPYIAEYENKG
jgi:Iap family predicted aminopeptidase